MAGKRLVDNTTLVTFRDRLSAVRKQANLSQEDMAKKLGLATPTYSAMERGVSQATISHLSAICSVLDVSSDYLLGFTSQPYGVEGMSQRINEEVHEANRLRAVIRTVSQLTAGLA